MRRGCAGDVGAPTGGALKQLFAFKKLRTSSQKQSHIQAALEIGKGCQKEKELLLTT